MFLSKFVPQQSKPQQTLSAKLTKQNIPGFVSWAESYGHFNSSLAGKITASTFLIYDRPVPGKKHPSTLFTGFTFPLTLFIWRTLGCIYKRFILLSACCHRISVGNICFWITFLCGARAQDRIMFKPIVTSGFVFKLHSNQYEKYTFIFCVLLENKVTASNFKRIFLNGSEFFLYVYWRTSSLVEGVRNMQPHFEGWFSNYVGFFRSRQSNF